MGNFYGSIHVRTDDRERVLAAVERLASDRRGHYLVSPARGGWSSVYPSGHGQDPTVSRALADTLDLPTIHLLMHDANLFAYWCYRERSLVDEYVSCPAYFEEATPEDRVRLAGNPARFSELFPGGPPALVEAEKVLADARSGDLLVIFESISRFAELLGIVDAATSYEHLKRGETDDVVGWDRFVHVPA